MHPCAAASGFRWKSSARRTDPSSPSTRHRGVGARGNLPAGRSGGRRRSRRRGAGRRIRCRRLIRAATWWLQPPVLLQSVGFCVGGASGTFGSSGALNCRSQSVTEQPFAMVFVFTTSTMCSSGSAHSTWSASASWNGRPKDQRSYQANRNEVVP